MKQEMASQSYGGFIVSIAGPRTILIQEAINYLLHEAMAMNILRRKLWD
jgi:hypothetical protein